MITLKLTPEELFEARFCVKRYSELYPMHPNEYMENVRSKIVDKLTVAYKQYQDNYHDVDPVPVPDNTCHQCAHWVKVGEHDNADCGACAMDGASIFEDDPACHVFSQKPTDVKHCRDCNHYAFGKCHLESIPMEVNPNCEACDRFKP